MIMNRLMTMMTSKKLLTHIPNPIKAQQQLISLISSKYATFKNDLPRIRVPHRTVLHYEKKKVKIALKKAEKEKDMKSKSQAIITSLRPELNHYLGQKYKKLNPQADLCSRGWQRVKYRGDWFIIKPFATNPALTQPLDETPANFIDYELSEFYLKRIVELGFNKPTSVQRKTIPRLLDGDNLIIASETGSGKSLAYLLPMVDKLTHLKETIDMPAIHKMARFAPRAVIIVPTRELAAQVKEMLDELTEGTVLRSWLLIDGEPSHRRKIDIAVSTPGLLLRYMEKEQGRIIMKRCQWLVMDEADTLLDDSFSHDIQAILGMNELIEDTTLQVTFVSATMPRNIKSILADTIDVDSLQIVKTDGLHYLMPHVMQKFMRLQASTRPAEILTLAKSNHEHNIPTMIFTNKTSTCVWLSKLLAENGIPNIATHSLQDKKRRRQTIKGYMKESKGLLVCTDICSRGINSIQVHQVINYDFPLHMSDYIHRAGRVGRVGSKVKGKVTSFVVEPWEIEMVQSIETSARLAKNLGNVNANIKRKIDNIVRDKFGTRDKKLDDDGKGLGKYQMETEDGFSSLYNVDFKDNKV